MCEVIAMMYCARSCVNQELSGMHLCFKVRRWVSYRKDVS